MSTLLSGPGPTSASTKRLSLSEYRQSFCMYLIWKRLTEPSRIWGNRTLRKLTGESVRVVVAVPFTTKRNLNTRVFVNFWYVFSARLNTSAANASTHLIRKKNLNLWKASRVFGVVREFIYIRRGESNGFDTNLLTTNSCQYVESDTINLGDPENYLYITNHIGRFCILFKTRFLLNSKWSWVLFIRR